jgi:hypothetical protein
MEARKQCRRIYWKPLIGIEIATILGIAWYLQMELFRTQQLPEYVTRAQISKIPFIEKNLQMQAKNVYSEMYRSTKCSQFILSDTGNDQLDGRIGFVDWYDEINVGYHAMICPQGSSNFRDGVPLMVKPENMESMTQVSPDKYNKNPKRDDYNVVTENVMPGKDGEHFTVKLRHDVFQNIFKTYDRLESRADEAYETMVRILDEKEKLEAEKEATIAHEQAEYENAMDKFMSTHKLVEDRPHKRRRIHDPISNTARVTQVQSVWKAKLDHMRTMMNKSQESDGEHLFTFPFTTIDNSLLCCGEGLKELNEHHINGVRHDAIFAKSMEVDSIIITTTSVRSLSPGLDIDEDIMNFCLKW